ncbi:MAG: hypothetical protein AAB855_01475 [Patescibacteria group bacterium]
MTLRVKIVFVALLVVGGLLIVLSIITAVRFFQERTGKTPVVEAPVEEQEEVSGTDSLRETVPDPTPQEPPQNPPPAQPGSEITSLTLPFVERFGSYSNQGNYENLTDLLPFMSSKMQGWAEKQIKEQTEKPFQELYRGVTTKALSYTTTRYEPQQGFAEMRVSTQRRELIGSTVNARVYNQDVVVSLVKDDGAWVVDSAFWQ